MLTAYVASDFWAAWFLSPGFGGAAAGLGALIALIGVLIALRNQRAVAQADRDARDQIAAEDRKAAVLSEQRDDWWSRAQWALNLVLTGDDAQVQGGYGFLRVLAESDLADVHQAALIASITDTDLDKYNITIENGAVTITHQKPGTP